MKTCILLSHTKCCSESLLPTISIDSIVSLISASIVFKSFSLLSTFDAKFGSYPGGTCFNQKKNINKISIKYTQCQWSTQRIQSMRVPMNIFRVQQQQQQ